MASDTLSTTPSWLQPAPLTLSQQLTKLIHQHGIAEILERLADIADSASARELVAALETAVEVSLKLLQTTTHTTTFSLPPNLPEPKFKFGDRVKETWEDIEEGKRSQWGEVTGMIWDADHWAYHCYWDKWDKPECGEMRPYYDGPTPEEYLQPG